MKKLLTSCVLMAASIACFAQTVIDNFTVGPYNVDYNGKDDVRYRLRDDVNLYEFFELEQDTVIVNLTDSLTPIKQAIQLSAILGANMYSTKEFGIEGLWKKDIAENLYFNAGLSFIFDYLDDHYPTNRNKMTTFELGVPVQLEWSNINRQKGTFYGLVGVTPAFYKVIKSNRDVTNSGAIITPSLEMGGNIPVGNVILRIGAYGKFKYNCSTSNGDIYRSHMGRTFIGGKISVIL